ncbi:kinesin-like protein KIN-14J isoform X2 [Trifolium pratense]|uniref:kinesin-like protein KIN-14J isoform X2 n=1 Tax=Trifolium pratense TaxID=57577 RepID=UPI001E6956B3|nr:kinesin-like protein KIN-14J isoform X2 [Trifolium pratense]XP_045823204.1 kinesin-like protein KIN-14J isoform X2 [Trifolium pratense]
MHWEQEGGGKGGTLNQIEEGDRLALLIEWINAVLPNFNLPLETSEEELRDCLSDGSVLCSILDKLVPGSLEGSGSLDELVGVERFLVALDELGLSGFEMSDLEQGSMLPVLQCLENLKSHFVYNAVRENIRGCSRKRWDQPNLTSPEETDSCLKDASNFQHAVDGSVVSDGIASIDHIGFKSNELLQLKQGLHMDLSDAKLNELLKSNNLDSVPTRFLFNIVNRILSDIFERKNGDIPQAQRTACLLRKILQVIELRFSNQAESMKSQNNIFKAREGKYQTKINALETLAVGTTEENEVVTAWVQQLKFSLQHEQNKFEEMKKLEEQDFSRLKKDKVRSEIEISQMKQDLEMAKRSHEEHVLQLELQASESKAEYEKRIQELKCHLADARKQVKELEAFSESRYLNWKNKEHTYQSFLNQQFGAFKELKAVMKSVKDEVIKTKRSYLEEYKYFGMKLKGLAEAADNYHVLLTENRKLYNEVQDLKGNIRVYCRVRPFLSGQSQKHTSVEFIGDDGELIISNPHKQGKESRKLFKFNKVFGQAASQEEVFLDTRPLIRSVLDGFNVCIFAYGQTGSGKTYTMSGPSLSSKSDWGVNYRALHDLFHISQSRKSSIDYEIGVQMVEIYNEQVRDLLSSNGPQKRLGIWNTTLPNGLAVPDASMHSVNSMKDVLELMNIGLMNRATSATALNERSSRSHSVLSIHVRGTEVKTNTLLRGCLHLVDLAGSERVDRSEATGDRLKEAQHINKSLSALGDVIFALAQKSPHVPYRNSKLTQLLQSSLGGQAKTLMFVQLNPDAASYSETISTLKFAERVSGVELGAARSNKEGRDVRELMEQMASLKDTVARKDEEIERLQLLKSNHNGAKLGMISPRHAPLSPRNAPLSPRLAPLSPRNAPLSPKLAPLSPRRHSIGTPRNSPHNSMRLSGTRSLGVNGKVAYDMDNGSEYSDKHSEAGSHQSIDDFMNKSSSLQLKLAREDVNQNFNDDIDLLGFGDADSEERLSDISDGGLSMGTETDSISSIVEYTLFPDLEKAAEITPAKDRASNNLPAQSTEKSAMPSRIPKAPQPQVQPKLPTRTSRLSLNRSTSKVSSSVKKPITGGSSSARSSKRWQ